MKRPDKDSSQQSLDSLVQVAAITAAHGIRGQVKLRSFTHNPDDIFDYSPLTDKTGKKTYAIKREGYKDQLFIVSIEGITDRNEAELLRGTELYAHVTHSGSTSENEWLYTDLKGLQARTADDRPYGTVIGVYNFGAGDIIDIELPDGKSEMLPFSKVFVGDIEVEKGYLVVFPPDYIEGPEEDEPEANGE